MIWLNPWAWLGVLGIALPIAIHLLGRGHARVIRFPSLRFVDVSRLLPTRRSRIQDPWLLAVRVAIVAVAALALAQPLLLTRGRRRALDRGLARAIIVDTSASMRRSVVPGRSALDSAMATGKQLAATAQTSIVVQSNDPAAALAGAVAWIARQERRGEIVLLSDFQRGQIDVADFAGVAAQTGIVLRKMAPSDSGISSAIFSLGGRAIDARASVTAVGTDVAWTAAHRDSTVNPAVKLFAGAGDANRLAALQSVASMVAVPLPLDTTRAIGILFPGYSAHDAIAASLRATRFSWAVALLANARREALPVVSAGDGIIEGQRRFILVTSASAASIDAARLVSLARQSVSTAPAPAELEPATVAESDLRRWERAPAESSPSQHRPLDDDGPSDGRWLWALVLVLLVVEWRLRRPAQLAREASQERARAA